MAENGQQLSLEDLRVEIRDTVRTFAEKLRAELGEDLRSVTVVGSSLTEDFETGKSDINTVLVLARYRHEFLEKLAGMAGSVRRKRISVPLFMTDEYIRRSCDVFGIEFLDFQLTHHTIFGPDPFKELTFTKEDVRLQCERELKATLIRLRQGYAAAGGRRGLVGDVVASAAAGLAPLLRAMLWLRDIERPVSAEAVFRKSAGEFGIEADCLIEASGWRHKRIRPGKEKIAATFEAVYAAVECLAEAVDRLEV